MKMFNTPRLEIEIKATGERKMMHDIDDAKESNYVLYDENYNVIEKIPYKDSRLLLDGKYPKWCLVIVRKSNEKMMLGGITGKEKWGNGYTISYLNGGDGIVYDNEIVEILDRDFYLESPIYTIAEFYSTWKKKEQIICPDCKKYWMYPSLYKGECSSCENGEFTFSKEFEHVELTDEIIRKHNAEVIIKSYKNRFTDITENARLRKWARKSACESLMKVGSELKKFYNFLDEDQLNELREVFKVEYSKVLQIVKQGD
jgi:hypothetical protein